MAKVDVIRLPDWHERLIHFVNGRRLMPYAYGTNDCWTFTQAAILEMTGTELFPEIKPNHWLSAAKVLIRNGWDSVEELISDPLGPPSEPIDTRPGDVVSFESCDSYHLAVRIGDSAVTPFDTGTMVIKSTQWRRSWKVG